MKNLTSAFLNLIVGGLLYGGLATTTALANHRSGDFALPENMAAADLDGDGNTDIMVNLSGFDNFAVFMGSSTGDFTLRRHVELDTLPKDIAQGDLNGDGRADIVSIAEWGYNIRVYLGDGRGGFQFASKLRGEGGPNRCALADLNKDGNLDMVVNGPQEGVLLIYLGVGGGHFDPEPGELERYLNPSVTTGDFNEDSNPDIAIAYFENTSDTGSHLQIFLGDGTGKFTVGSNVIIDKQPDNLNVVDLNHDGHSDLIIAGAVSENVAGIFISSYLGDGKGHFTQKQSINLGTGSLKGKIGVGDFNGDGNDDIAFPLSSDGINRGDFSTALLIFLGDGTGNFTQGQTVTVGQEPGSALPGDFNKDGKTDLVVTNRTDSTLSVLFGNGDGTFTTHATLPVVAVPTP